MRVKVCSRSSCVFDDHAIIPLQSCHHSVLYERLPSVKAYPCITAVAYRVRWSALTREKVAGGEALSSISILGIGSLSLFKATMRSVPMSSSMWDFRTTVMLCKDCYHYAALLYPLGEVEICCRCKNAMHANCPNPIFPSRHDQSPYRLSVALKKPEPIHVSQLQKLRAHLEINLPHLD